MELKATDLMLDMGVSIPIRPIRYLGKRSRRRVVMRTPYMGNLMRIARLHLKSHIVLGEVRDYTAEQNMAFMAEHGVLVSRMVALTMVRGQISGLLLGRIVAWWLRWRVHPIMLQEAWFQMMTALNISPFMNIINSAQRISLMRPRLSQKRNRS